MAVRSDEKNSRSLRLSAVRQFHLLETDWRRARTADLAEVLKAQGLLIRDCANYPGLSAAYGRTAVRTHEENERFVALLAENIR